MNITCRKTCCKYNSNFVCMAKDIDIGKNSECKTFEEDSPTPDTSKTFLKKPPKYHRFRAIRDLPITCTAKCQFNHDCHCHANGITVNALADCPYCVTYLQKLKK